MFVPDRETMTETSQDDVQHKMIYVTVSVMMIKCVCVCVCYKGTGEHSQSLALFSL